ncbi:hypothetical protein CMI37_31865 [Candidatus Pacearchaeota archaeon]|nr:hypothetical protein [Candidatus Pacearchaeota archaeon]
MGSFPNKIYGDYGDEKVVGSTKLHELGHAMELPDGRTFRYARAGGTALVPGKLYQGKGEEANTSLAKAAVVPSSSVAINSRKPVVTIAGTALAADVFADGYLTVSSSVGTGVGHTYKIASNNSCAAGSTTTLTLAGNDKLAVALEAGTTRVALRKSPYDEVILTTANTVFTNAIAGVAAASAAASDYVWLQRTGECAVFVDATTLVIGQPVKASTTVAGAVGPISNTASTDVGKSKYTIGQYIGGGTSGVSASAEYALTNLKLE